MTKSKKDDSFLYIFSALAVGALLYFSNNTDATKKVVATPAPNPTPTPTPTPTDQNNPFGNIDQNVNTAVAPETVTNQVVLSNYDKAKIEARKLDSFAEKLKFEPNMITEEEQRNFLAIKERISQLGFDVDVSNGVVTLER